MSEEKKYIDNNINVLIDQREQKVIPYFDTLLKNDFNNFGIKTEILTLTTADFAITYRNNILVLIERKTWKDLSATFKDQKRKFNYKKMLEERSKHSTCIMVAYLIEGIRYNNRKSKICNIPYGRLQAHLDHLILEHNIHILYSKDKLDTAYRILELTKNIITIRSDKNPIDKLNKEGNIKKGAAKVALTAKKNLDDSAVIALLWSSVKGVSCTLAGVFIKENLFIRDMILGKYTIAQIQAIRYPSARLIGEKYAKKIIQRFTSLKQGDDAVKFLSSIPSISKKSAKIILNSISIKEIVNLTKTEKERVANIQFTSRRKIGNSISMKIIKFLGNSCN